MAQPMLPTQKRQLNKCSKLCQNTKTKFPQLD